MSEFQNDVAEIIDGVHDSIAENGWTRGALHGPGGSACILGGIDDVRQALDLHSADARLAAAREKISEIIGEETHHRHNSIPHFNDIDADDLDEVLELLRFAANDIRQDALIDSGGGELWDEDPEEESDDGFDPTIEEEIGTYVPEIIVPDFVPTDLLETVSL